jgi:TetR/AcrR family transcriptional regulator, transcriptional repressor for nem operon
MRHQYNDDLCHHCQSRKRNVLMKVSRQQVQQNRERILDAAARLFRERGVDGVSVAEVMKAAGLTHGGFYGHFDSKAELVKEALVQKRSAAWGKRVDTGSAADFANAYLSTEHRDDPGNGCPVAGLSSEAARASPDVRATLTESIRREIERLAAASPGATAARRRRAAIATYSAMVGAVVLSRIVDDRELSKEILAATRGSINLG